MKIKKNARNLELKTIIIIQKIHQNLKIYDTYQIKSKQDNKIVNIGEEIFDLKTTIDKTEHTE